MTAPPTRTTSHRRATLALLAVFAGTRLVAYALGIRFDAELFADGWQFLDPVLLQTDLAQSLWLLHAQPPLFNALMGASLKLFGGGAVVAWQVVFAACSFGVGWGMMRLMLRFGFSLRASWIVAALYLASPTAILFETWFFYAWPLAALFVGSTLLLWRYLDAPSVGRAAAFAASLATASLIWSAFHLIWLVAGCIGLALVRREHVRTVLLGAALPILVVGAVYAKNQAVFGTFAASSWSGMNLKKVAVLPLPEADRERLIASGQLTESARTYPFATVQEYQDAGVAMPPLAGHPALDAVVKSSGAPNFNHRLYLPASEVAGADAVAVIENRPAFYGIRVVLGMGAFTRPASDYAFVDERSDRLAAVREVYDVLLYGNLREPIQAVIDTPESLDDPLSLGGLVALSLILLTAVGLRLSWAVFRGRELPARDAVLLFIACMAAYLWIVGSLAESGENERFRVTVEPLMVVATAAVVADVWAWWQARRAEKAVPAAAAAAPPA